MFNPARPIPFFWGFGGLFHAQVDG